MPASDLDVYDEFVSDEVAQYPNANVYHPGTCKGFEKLLKYSSKPGKVE